MIAHTNDRQRISRRAALTASALALGTAIAAIVVRQAAAQEKTSQVLAQYQSTPKGNEHCEVCIYFQSPHACKYVRGEISPRGWCQLFTLKSRSK